MLREINLISVIVRMLLAFVLGGAIGTERELKRKSAGLKTHILICVGAAMTTMTSQYLVTVMGEYTDIARLGAQVISGVGFIGAGIIFITRGRRVKGLTTAAGIWLCAVIGLCVGAGYYEGAIVAAAFMVFIEFIVSRLEKKYFTASEQDTIFVIYNNPATPAKIASYLHDLDITICSMPVPEGTVNKLGFEAEYNLLLQRKVTLHDVLTDIAAIDGVISAEESDVS